MRTPVVLAGFILTALVAFACSDNDPTPVVNVTTPTAPTPPPKPACEANHTADVAFQNLGESFIDVLLDGSYIGTLPPESPAGFEQAVASGIAHTLDFRVPNGTAFVCPTVHPVPVQCSKVIWGSCYYGSIISTMPSAGM